MHALFRSIKFAVNVVIHITLGPSITESVQTVQTGCSDDKQQAYDHLNQVVSNAKSRTSFASKSNRILNLVQKSNLCALSELTLLKRQQDFSISAFQ